MHILDRIFDAFNSSPATDGLQYQLLFVVAVLAAWWICRWRKRVSLPLFFVVGNTVLVLGVFAYALTTELADMTPITVLERFPMYDIAPGSFLTTVGRLLARPFIDWSRAQSGWPGPVWRYLLLPPPLVGLTLGNLFWYGVGVVCTDLPHRRKRRRVRAGCCIQCAYDLRGSSGLVCPECGRDNTSAVNQYGREKTSRTP